MANGRSSCTVGAYEAAEVYSNASGGASSVTLNAHTTDKDKCFNISVNISDTAQTVQAETSIAAPTNLAVNCACCFEYGGTFGVALDSSDNFFGLSCVESNASMGVRHFYDCACTHYCRCSDRGVDTFRENYFAPVPWVGNFPCNPVCCDSMPLFLTFGLNCCCDVMTVVNLYCYCSVNPDATVKDDRFCELVTKRCCAYGTFIENGECDRDGCCGITCCNIFRPNYGIIGHSGTGGLTQCGIKGFCSGFCNTFIYDYWQSGCGRGATQLSKSCCCCTSFCCCLAAHRLTLGNHVCDKRCCHDPSGVGCTGMVCLAAQNHVAMVFGCHGNIPTTYCLCVQSVAALGNNLFNLQKISSTGCDFVAHSLVTTGAACNSFVWFAGGQNFAPHEYHRTSTNCCSLYNMCFTGNGASPIKWVTYNNYDNKNYMMWWHDNTSDVNGIYTVDTSKVCAALTTTANTTCSVDASSGEFLSAFTKVADIPSTLVTAANGTAYNVIISTAVATGPKQFSFFFDNVTESSYTYSTFPRCQMVSEDLKTWTYTKPDSYFSKLSADKYLTGDKSNINILCNCYNSILCDSGQIENQTQGINLERTGVVTSNGDKVYVTNCGGTPVSINVWGYEE